MGEGGSNMGAGSRTVTVTEADIAAGERKRCTVCPVALAMKRDLGWKFAFAGPTYLRDGISKDQVPTPPAVLTFMDAFDSGSPVRPFSFTVEG